MFSSFRRSFPNRHALTKKSNTPCWYSGAVLELRFGHDRILQRDERSTRLSSGAGHSCLRGEVREDSACSSDTGESYTHAAFGPPARACAMYNTTTSKMCHTRALGYLFWASFAASFLFWRFGGHFVHVQPPALYISHACKRIRRCIVLILLCFHHAVCYTYRYAFLTAMTIYKQHSAS